MDINNLYHPYQQFKLLMNNMNNSVKQSLVLNSLQTLTVYTMLYTQLFKFNITKKKKYNSQKSEN